MFKNIIFDYGNVFAKWDTLHMARLYTDSDEDAITFRNTFFTNWQKLDTGEYDKESYLNNLPESFPKRLMPSAKKFLDNCFYDTPPVVETFEVAKELLKDHNVFLLSNIACWFKDVLPTIEVVRDFNGFILSGNEKKYKPTVEVFLYAIEKFKVDPKETLYIDDLPANIEGAKKAGFNTFLFDTKNPSSLKEYLKQTGDIK